MDPVTTTAVVAAVNAVASGAGGEVGRRALSGLHSLARRVIRSNPPEDGVADAEPLPRDEIRLRVLADLLVERAGEDPEFGRELAAWLRETEQLAEPGGVHNSVSGSAQVNGPVIQARDISGPISFGS